MFQRYRGAPGTPKHFQPIGDIVVLAIVGLLIFGTVATAERWAEVLQPAIRIDLSLHELPTYALYSVFRALIAYSLSLSFSLLIGYWAAKSKSAERFILPLLDIAQSIPVLGFLPGLVLGLISLFPHSSFGIEMACIIMIFTGQVWNLTFSYYSSLKAIPTNFFELSENVRLTAPARLFNIELPFALNALAWNSLMSMAGGWFFLTVCEAFTLEDHEFRLPGLGSYMSMAIAQGNGHAMFAGFVAMVLVIVSLDFFFWRPVVAWTRRFRLDDQQEGLSDVPFVEILLRDSWILEQIKAVVRFLRGLRFMRSLSRFLQSSPAVDDVPSKPSKASSRLWPLVGRGMGMVIFIWAIWLLGRLLHLLAGLPRGEIAILIEGTAATAMRVIFALIVSSLWAVPFGIWVGISPQRTRFFQPIVQVAASFPAPMLYPFALVVLRFLHIPLGIGAGVLMLLGVQWYVLFNVLAGATTISTELRDSFRLIGASARETWTKLYLPSVFPSLVTGWVTAAGGAWNVSIVAEFINFQGETLKTTGIGAVINEATARGNYPLLAGALVTMVVVVVAINRTVWRRIYAIAETRFRFER